MTEGNIKALRRLREGIVERRREAASGGDVIAVIEAQKQIVLIDEAIADERALGQAQKDEEAMGRAMRQDDAKDIGEVSIIADAIKLG
ncbi:MAG: hypothetical protein EOP19_24165 [Hyphomicrobiales bacterium]|nr:MAG: hypothetical protein EOP19_24165 [Hyphomicrobiales bacterium]